MAFKDRFYMACTRDSVGSKMSFHGNGYSTDTRKAHTFSREEAQRAWETGRDIDQPISASHVDECAVYAADIQHVKLKDEGQPPYYLVRRNRFDGNDIYFRKIDGNLSWEITSDIKQYPEIIPELQELYYFVPVSHIEEIKRPVFKISDFNPRKMVQAAGLVTPKHIKLERNRKSNPKSVLNCGGCGHFFCSYNPYEEHCEDCRNFC